VRHGETQESRLGIIQGQLNTRLTETGKREALAVGDYMASQSGLNNIITSDLDRTIETAQLIASRIKQRLPISSVAALREISSGVLEGRPYQELADLRKAAGSNWKYVAPPGGESYEDMRRRVLEWYERFLGEAPAGTLIIGHRGPITVILSSAKSRNNLEDILSIALRPCAITALTLTNNAGCDDVEIINTTALGTQEQVAQESSN
jgi:broad specificity phosphatase PhoE